MLRITGHDERVEEWLRPIPFRRHADALERGRTARDEDRPDSVRMAEAALERAQRDIDEMNRLLDGPIRFSIPDGDDDGPSAA